MIFHLSPKYSTFQKRLIFVQGGPEQTKKPESVTERQLDPGNPQVALTGVKKAAEMAIAAAREAFNKEYSREHAAEITKALKDYALLEKAMPVLRQIAKLQPIIEHAKSASISEKELKAFDRFLVSATPSGGFDFSEAGLDLRLGNIMMEDALNPNAYGLQSLETWESEAYLTIPIGNLPSSLGGGKMRTPENFRIWAEYMRSDGKITASEARIVYYISQKITKEAKMPLYAAKDGSVPQLIKNLREMGKLKE